MKNKTIVTICTIVLMLVSTGLSFNTVSSVDNQTSTFNVTQRSIDDYTNITVNETWDLLNDTSNGIQIPVDVRRDNEWALGYIDTPCPESPIHYELAILQTPNGLDAFMDMYDGEDVILYCAKGGRSFVATNILIAAGFTGTIYNMVGGMGAWLDAGLPIRNNSAPVAPTIDGKAKGKNNKEYEYTLKATDPEKDCVKFMINWGDNETEETDFVMSDEEVKVKHTHVDKGEYNITAKTIDFYGNESGWTTLKVTRPKSIRPSFNILSWLLEHFPIIKILLGI